MLNQDTKKKIDGARDILVGKIPDPKAQVEQITTALIYKFMDDMDKESVEVGGKARFFTEEYAKYSWSKLLDVKLGGQVRLNIYTEALEKLSLNPNIPQLFRSIFKNSYLPYRDPETLSLFLKEINWFSYDHSEDLGDAYEYLLSIMGSQGDAGQFRTPRHIIDFIVNIINPDKDETVLDPACGTAGFLISAYKHVLARYTDDTENSGKGTQHLTPIEKTSLMDNYVGYDISPDMVKISLVNMYLHGFTSPRIHEYDTLTSEEKWEETYDIIMANPPFMTPKGGIRPHKRFAIKANRSELLFVDYIVEHIKQSGRAGIIVPDGIVSNKNSSAYVDIRKKLVDEGYCYAVVSLHAGVFKPYADVKTSILLIDRAVASKIDKVFFLEIENDGYEKGNRKRKIPQDDLPDTLDTLLKLKDSILNGRDIEKLIKTSSKLFTVNKRDISSDGYYILRSNKYRANITVKGNLPIEKLRDHIFELSEVNNFTSSEPVVFSVSNSRGLIDSRDYFNRPVQSENLAKYKVVPPESFVFNPARANVGSLVFNDTGKSGLVSPMYNVFKIKEESLLVPEYLYYLLKSSRGIEQIKLLSSGAVRQTLKIEDLYEMSIPIPQRTYQISFKNDHGLQRYLKLAIDCYEPYIKINPNWKSVKLIDYFVLTKGDQAIEKSKPGEYKLVTTADEFETCDRYQFDGEAVCVPMISSAGHGKATLNRIYYVSGKFAVGNILMAMTPKNEQVVPKFYYYLFSQEKDNIFTNLMYGTTNVSYKIDDCKDVQILLPDKDEQLEILSYIESEKNNIEYNMNIVDSIQKRINDKIDEIWRNE
ncbi:MAG: hypothetical protein UU64_C0018G0005 [candidate division WWE3 bacterium GW2011_GWF2_41_45]|nr:MAG: hypothetical protein UU64_C0018G0005 [candidate division WWE3 bacterium GW2011_GWF2_41_45]KKS54303.1 MAG: hypothetical protein UV21_C0011G0005 [candidate division WWE3 bacterium GW2011_GWD2_42_34]